MIDIKFDKENATKQQILCSEIMPPIIEKQKILEAKESSVYQLLDSIRKTPVGVPKTYLCTQKSHVNMFPKNSFHSSWRI